MSAEKRARELIAEWRTRQEQYDDQQSAESKKGYEVDWTYDARARSFEQAADELESLLDSAALTPQWHPISTAPRDGTRVLIAGGTFSYEGYGPYFSEQVVIAYWYRDHWRGEDRQAHDEWYVHEPTKWLPLPAPPEGD